MACSSDTLDKSATDAVYWQVLCNRYRIKIRKNTWHMNSRDNIWRIVFHNGWWHGYRTAFHRRLKDKITIVVLSNQLNKSAYHTYRVYEIFDNRLMADSLAGFEE